MPQGADNAALSKSKDKSTNASESKDKATNASDVTLEHLPDDPDGASHVLNSNISRCNYIDNKDGCQDTPYKKDAWRQCRDFQNLIQRQQSVLLSLLKQVTREQETIKAEMVHLERLMPDVRQEEDIEAKEAEMRLDISRDLEDFARSRDI
ncbi:MAG: hypothetical protein M1816_003642 [Peltula sp. TS41687]|nr:MAG: hypothetical protein M1816_003642 [Peltula sp. TS41687]